LCEITAHVGHNNQHSGLVAATSICGSFPFPLHIEFQKGPPDRFMSSRRVIKAVLPLAPLITSIRTTTMSQVPNANFFIVNKTPTSDGTLLAATYTGEGDAVTVTEFANEDSQVVRLL
jgi:hypothetical protein